MDELPVFAQFDEINNLPELYQKKYVNKLPENIKALNE